MLRRLPSELRAFLLLLVSLWAVAIAFCIVRTRQSGDADVGFLSLKMPNVFFDLTCYTDRFLHLHHDDFFTLPGFRWMYPAASSFIYWILYNVRLPYHGFRTFMYPIFFAIVLVVAFMASRLARALHARGLSQRSSVLFVTASALFSWPIYFAIERGNIEAILWFLIAAAIWAYARQRWMLAAILIGLVAAFKIYPILLLGLFLRPLRWRQLLAGIATAALVTLAGLFFLDPNIAYAFHQTQDGVRHFVDLYTLQFDPAAIGYDHSIFSVVKQAARRHTDTYPALLRIYTAAIGLIMCVLFFLRAWRLPRPNQLLFLIVATVMIPATSSDYTLQSLYIPFAWLTILAISAAARGTHLRGMFPAMLCFALIFGPETFLSSHGVLFSGQVKALVLIALTVIALTFPFPEEAAPPLSSASHPA